MGDNRFHEWDILSGVSATDILYRINLGNNRMEKEMMFILWFIALYGLDLSVICLLSIAYPDITVEQFVSITMVVVCVSTMLLLVGVKLFPKENNND